MSKKYLVAVDGSDHAWKATDVAATLAKAAKAELILLHILPHEALPEGFERWGDQEGVSLAEMRARFRESRSQGDAVVEEAKAHAKKLGVQRIETKVIEGDAAVEIVEVARTEKADMLFLGSRGMSDVRGMLVGSVSHKVLHLSPCTCVLVK
jgi:nucleotide-binding universal stress UspA family protein